MIKHQAHKIYAIALDFEYGFVFAEILDFSEVSDFDGILVQVYSYRVKDTKSNISVSEITSSGLFLGPMPINMYPVTKGKNAWKLWGENFVYDSSSPYFKYYPGMLKAKNWSTLTPWFKQSEFTEQFYNIEFSYEEIRYLETRILNHQEAIKIKCTMRFLINDSKDVGEFYNLNEMAYRNMYVQVVNTYYDLETANRLLRATYDLK